ncbi:probable serine/threonine-protein kinase kinX isoform X4 [Periplaneta americana]|uniref:probable serine/threonine-protein kinase kinX isoform X4 n=1 Tax=Periplaneta americana TaxID=6978 RepID=UPI0037E765A2
MEPALDLLGSQLHDDTYEMEGNEPLSEERNLSHLEVSGMKTESVDQSYDQKSEMKVEDTTPVPINFPMVKSEVPIKVEDTTPVPINFPVVKSEVPINVEDTIPVPISFPMLKTDVDEDLLDLDSVHEAEIVELTSEEDEVLIDTCDG